MSKAILNKKDIYSVIPLSVIKEINKNLEINVNGIHGINHWLRVLTNGFIINDAEKFNTKILIVFAFIHDAFRVNDYEDKIHGHRAKNFILDKNPLTKKINLTDREKEVLAFACLHHSDGKTIKDFENNDFGFNESEIKDIVSCWDADRLDLARVSILPDPKYLSTEHAKISSIIMLCNKYAFQNELFDFYKDLRSDIL